MISYWDAWHVLLPVGLGPSEPGHSKTFCVGQILSWFHAAHIFQRPEAILVCLFCSCPAASICIRSLLDHSVTSSCPRNGSFPTNLQPTEIPRPTGSLKEPPILVWMIRPGIWIWKESKPWWSLLVRPLQWQQQSLQNFQQSFQNPPLTILIIEHFALFEFLN